MTLEEKKNLCQRFIKKIENLFSVLFSSTCMYNKVALRLSLGLVMTEVNVDCLGAIYISEIHDTSA